VASPNYCLNGRTRKCFLLETGFIRGDEELKSVPPHFFNTLMSFAKVCKMCLSELARLLDSAVQATGSTRKEEKFSLWGLCGGKSTFVLVCDQGILAIASSQSIFCLSMLDQPQEYGIDVHA
jgi:hypothetical protein